MAERICVKFTGKTCFVPHSEEFECQGERSKVKVTRDKNALSTLITPRQHANGMCCCKQHAAAADGTIPSLPGDNFGACVQFMFGKTSLALVHSKFLR